VFGLLTAFTVNLLRRTKETDDRRDDATRIAMELATERERRAFEERDRAIAERDAAERQLRTDDGT
jgi:hypothetical protein